MLSFLKESELEKWAKFETLQSHITDMETESICLILSGTVSVIKEVFLTKKVFNSDISLLFL